MQKRFAQVTAMALLIATMAGPAYAGNGKDHENRGRGNGFGKFFAEIKKDLKLEFKEFKKAKKEERKEEKKNDESTLRLCLKAAEETHNAAVRLANAERDASLAAARTAYHQAIAAAQKTRHDAVMSALVTFKASDMGSSAQATFVAAYVKAHADWQTAKNAAQTAWDAAKAPVQAKWQAAKVKADAEYRAAKEKCKAETTTPPPTTTPDTTAPSTPSISLSAATVSSILVSWTAPGDDGSTGTAASYDLRYSTSPIVTAADFTNAAQASGEPAPAVAGTAQSMTVSGLTANTTYHFALQAKDEANNVSATSNAPSLATLAVVVDVTAPAAIANLSLSAPTSSGMIVAWTAPGDDGSTGTAASYDLRYSTSPIATDADFTAATAVTGEPAPTAAGTSQSMAVTGLSASTTYYFAMKSQDEVPNVSVMSNVPSLATIAP